jgi:hypothetical protein
MGNWKPRKSLRKSPKKLAKTLKIALFLSALAISQKSFAAVNDCPEVIPLQIEAGMKAPIDGVLIPEWAFDETLIQLKSKSESEAMLERCLTEKVESEPPGSKAYSFLAGAGAGALITLLLGALVIR